MSSSGDLLKKELKDSGALKVKSEAAQSESQALREEVETLKKENAALKAKASEEERALPQGKKHQQFCESARE